MKNLSKLARMVSLAVCGVLTAGGVASAQEAGDAHAHHHMHADDDAAAGRVPTPDGMSIAVIAPVDGAQFDATATIAVEVKTAGMDVSGDHWHLYADDELLAMVGGGRTQYDIAPGTLAPGHHALKVTISNASHHEYAVEQRLSIQIGTAP